MLTIALIVLVGWLYYRSRCRFNAKDWKADRGRTDMVSSIINTGLLDHKSYDDVLTILGKPSFFEDPQPELGIGRLGQTRLDYSTGEWCFLSRERLMVIIENDTVVQVFTEYAPAPWGL